MTSEERKNWQKEMKRQLGIVLRSFFALLLIFLMGYILSHYSFWTQWMSIAWVILLMVSVAYVFLFKFIPEGIYMTQIEEGTAQVIMELGRAVKGLIQYKDSTIKGLDWDVAFGKETHLFGGLRWVGLWPIRYKYRYVQRWTSVRENGDAVPHEEELDSILLKEKIYLLRLEGAEDKDGIPINVDLLITGKVVKIYKALFGPHNYLEQIQNRTRPLFREHIRKYSFMELSAQKQRAGGELWKKLDDEGMVNIFDSNGDIQTIGEFERDYGFRIKNGGIEMTNITPPPEYQKAQTQKRLAETEAERIAGETMGAVINMMAASRGITQEEIQKQINNSNAFQKEFRGYCVDILHKKMAIDGGSYVKIDVSGAGGTEKTLMDLAAAWLRMPQGNKNQGAQKKNKKKELSSQETMARIERHRKTGGKMNLTSEDDEGE